MSGSVDRTRRAEAVGVLQRAEGQGLHAALKDLLEEELAEARDELEGAGDDITIWRAQGRAMEIRRLLSAVTSRA